MENIINELVLDYGNPIIVKDIELYFNIKSMGTFELDYKNGQLWTYSGKLYHLSHLYLSPKDLQIVIESYK